MQHTMYTLGILICTKKNYVLKGIEIESFRGLVTGKTWERKSNSSIKKIMEKMSFIIVIFTKY
jgi:hypothetical protein